MLRRTSIISGILMSITFFSAYGNARELSLQEIENFRKQQAPRFANIIYIGHSLTAGLFSEHSQYRKYLKYYRPKVQKLSGKEDLTFGNNPAQLMANPYLSILSKDYTVEAPVQLATMMFSSIKDFGGLQINSLLNLKGKNNLAYQKATVIYGTDLFYWDAIYNNCNQYSEYSGHAYTFDDKELTREFDGHNHDAESQLKRLIRQAKKDNKVLFLGTTPVEKENQIFIPKRILTMSLDLWKKPDSQCAEKINRIIRTLCTAENGCYYADLYQVNKHLSTGGLCKVNVDDNEYYDLLDLRTDGVNFSAKGSELIAKILEINFMKGRFDDIQRGEALLCTDEL